MCILFAPGACQLLNEKVLSYHTSDFLGIKTEPKSVVLCWDH